jgi:hypothetical protein
MRVMKTRFLLCTYLIVITFVAVPARAQTSSTEGAEQFAELGDFKLRDGSIIQDFRLGYRTLGKLNTERSNAILWPTWLGGKSEDLLKFLGPGKVVDTANYFVILVDAHRQRNFGVALEQQEASADEISDVRDSRHGGGGASAGHRGAAPAASARGDGDFHGRDADL